MPTTQFTPAAANALHIPHWSEGLATLHQRSAKASIATAPPRERMHIPHWREGLANMSHRTKTPVCPTLPSRPVTAFAGMDQGQTERQWLLTCAQVLADALLAQEPVQNRPERENRQWLQACAQFMVLWAHRQEDTVADDHPLQDWITRQRKHHRNNHLMPWKRRLLDQIDFPYIAARKSSTPSNLEYAQKLCAFGRENGHYAPTIGQGGGGLTRWVRLMRQSNGTQGMEGEGTASARNALAYLQQEIPGFKWEKTVKSEHNQTQGLTFNGYTPAKREPRTGRVRTRRCTEVLERAESALRFAVMLQRVHGDRSNNAVLASLDELLRRAVFYDQAVRVQLTPFGATATQTWWLHGTTKQPASRSTPTELVLRRSATPASTTVQMQTAPIDKVISLGYSTDGSLYQLKLIGTDGCDISLDYDALLADQTHAGQRRPRSFECRTRIDWQGWLDNETRPKKLLSIETTANATFELNLGKLKAWLERNWKVGQPTRWQDHQIDYSKSGYHYKFIEHMVLKKRQGKMQASHAERLAALNFTWGSLEKSSIDMFG